MSLTKYPREIARVVRDKTFYVNAYPSAVNKDADADNYYPLMLHGRFSRYEFNLINEKKQGMKDNIPIMDMKRLIRKADVVANKHLEMTLFPSEEKQSLPAAYTVQIKSGKLKGKTPAQAIFEMGEEGVKLLRNQYTFLKANVDRFPKNMEQMNAIAEAGDLYNKGLLDADIANKNKTVSITLYEAKSRINIYKTRADGMAPVRDMLITFDLGAKNPVSISITNYYAPVMKLENGLNRAVPEQMDRSTYVTCTMTISFEEWMEAIDNIRMNIRMFENEYSHWALSESEYLDAQNRREAAERNASAVNSNGYSTGSYVRESA